MLQSGHFTYGTSPTSKYKQQDMYGKQIGPSKLHGVTCIWLPTITMLYPWSLGGGGGIQSRISVSQILCAICSVFLRICMGVRQAVPLLTRTMPEDLVNDNWFPMKSQKC